LRNAGIADAGAEVRRYRGVARARTARNTDADGLPGWPGPAPPGAVLPTLPLVVPLEPLLVPPVCASVIAEEAASMVASSGTRTRISASSEGSLR
jgi:hypothetical protein